MTSGSAPSERPVAADVEIADEPAQHAIGLGEVRQVLHEEDQRREERVQRDAGEQQHVRREAALPRAGQRIDDRDRAERSGKAGDRHRGHAAPLERPSERDRQHRAERRAGRDAKRERRGEGIAQQSLEDDTRRRQRCADQRACERARHPRDEEDLRVDVVAERDRRIERPAQTDRSRAGERRQEIATAASEPKPRIATSTRRRIG